MLYHRPRSMWSTQILVLSVDSCFPQIIQLIQLYKSIENVKRHKKEKNNKLFFFKHVGTSNSTLRDNF